MFPNSGAVAVLLLITHLLFQDNPYIIVEVEETQAGNNYYLNPVDDPRLSRHQPSTSGYYESPSPLNFEPIDTPKSATKDESRGYVTTTMFVNIYLLPTLLV